MEAEPGEIAVREQDRRGDERQKSQHRKSKYRKGNRIDGVAIGKIATRMTGTVVGKNITEGDFHADSSFSYSICTRFHGTIPRI